MDGTTENGLLVASKMEKHGSDMAQDTARSEAVFVLTTDSFVSVVVRTGEWPYMQCQLAVINQSCAPRDCDISASMSLRSG